MTNFIFKIISDPKTKISRKPGILCFENRGKLVMIPKGIGAVILRKIKRKQFGLIRQMIDIYKDELVTNFKV